MKPQKKKSKTDDKKVLGRNVRIVTGKEKPVKVSKTRRIVTVDRMLGKSGIRPQYGKVAIVKNGILHTVPVCPLSETKGMIRGLNTRHLRDDKGQITKTVKDREHPLLRLKPAKFRAKVRGSEIDKLLYGSD
jgi:hypothetical protein